MLYLHEPDPETLLEETLGAVDDLIRAGKIRYLGLSNFPASQVVEALWIADRRNLRRVAATQDLYNLFERANEHDLYPTCITHEIGAMAYAPLGGGLLTGKYTPEMVSGATAIPEGTRASYYGQPTDDFGLGAGRTGGDVGGAGGHDGGAIGGKCARAGSGAFAGRP